MSAKFVNGKIVEFNNPTSPVGVLNGSIVTKYNSTGSYTVDTNGFYSISLASGTSGNNVYIYVNSEEVVHGRILYSWSYTVNCQMFLKVGDVITHAQDNEVCMNVRLLSTNI